MTLLVLFLVLLAVTAPRWGADTRDGRDWQPPDPARRNRTPVR